MTTLSPALHGQLTQLAGRHHASHLLPDILRTVHTAAQAFDRALFFSFGKGKLPETAKRFRSYAHHDFEAVHLTLGDGSALTYHAVLNRETKLITTLDETPLGDDYYALRVIEETRVEVLSGALVV